MLKGGDLARREDHRVKGSKAGDPDQIGGISHVWSLSLCFNHFLNVNYKSIICLNLNYYEYHIWDKSKYNYM